MSGGRPGPDAAPRPGALPPPWRQIALGTVGSTNDEARRLAGQGAAHGTVVTAERQEAGRGRRGRGWDSPAGNLYASLVLRPGCALADAAQLSFVAALATVEALRGLLPAGVAVRAKWPNDVLVDGAKVAGILLEAEADAAGRLDWLVLGIGVNVRHFPADAPYPATALLARGATAEPQAVLAAFLARLAHWAGRWQSQGFAPVRAAWLAVAHGLNGPVTVRLEGAALPGRFAGLDADGALLLEQAGGRRRIAAGDVFFGDPPQGA